VTLNIDDTQNDVASDAAPGAAAKAPRPLVAEVIDELTSWNPREFIAAFRRWHQGSFSLIHLNVLTLLEAEGAISMSRLADALDISVASATGVVDRMEHRGLVLRRHDIGDRRVVLVHAAPGGETVFGEIDARRRSHLALLLDRLTDEELDGLLRGHRALRAARAQLAREAHEADQAGEAQGPAQAAPAVASPEPAQ
jgi:DNA-binding MarR family transcriptional regulator